MKLDDFMIQRPLICQNLKENYHDPFKTGAIKEEKLSKKGILHLNRDREI